jgi:hypothetical protein
MAPAASRSTFSTTINQRHAPLADVSRAWRWFFVPYSFPLVRYLTKRRAMNSWESVHALIESPQALPTYNLSGLAVYYHLLHQGTGETEHQQQAKNLFEQQLRNIDSHLATATFSLPETNVAALAWLYSRLQVQGQYDTSTFARLDAFLHAEAQRLVAAPDQPWAPLLPILRYFLQRLPNGAVTAYLHELVAALYNGGQTLTQRQAAGTIPLGLSNGLAGELLLLIDLYNAGIRNEVMLGIVREGISALLHTKREVDFQAGRYSIFPDSVNQSWQQPVYSNQLSWGHGVDLGVSLVLYKAQALLGDAELGKIAELVGLNTLLRTEPQTTALRSSQFCQGTAGVAYLYYQLYQLSHNPAYQQGYRFWLNQTEQWLSQELPTGFYQMREHVSRCGVLGIAILLRSLTDQPARPLDGPSVAAVELL